MSTLPALSATPAALTLAGPAGEHDPVSASALTDDPCERCARLVVLMAERYAPDRAHESTDDNAVRRALDAAARSRRW
jgi:hypothetical protein